MKIRMLGAVLFALGCSTATGGAPDLVRPGPVSDTTTTESGLRYVFLKRGNGPVPKAGDVMVIHGVGRFPDGKEFWNTRTENAPYEFTPGVDRVIRGFEEGMKYVRSGDRIEITMKPELGYGERGNRDIPPNSTLIFDYEILSVHPLSIAKLLRDGIAALGVDSTLALARKLPDLKKYYVSESSLTAAANAAGRTERGNTEKVLQFGITLMPKSYRLQQSLARTQTQSGAIADAIRSYEAALRLNPHQTEAQKRDYEATTKSIADLRARS